mgnify:CR=1 FL=1
MRRYLDARRRARSTSEARELERLDKKLAKEEAWLRQGVKARRTRNEGRVKALDGAARRARGAARSRVGTVRMAVDARQSSPASSCSRPKSVSKALGGVPVIRDYLAARSFAAIASASSARTDRARRRCSGCCSASSSRTPETVRQRRAAADRLLRSTARAARSRAHRRPTPSARATTR